MILAGPTPDRSISDSGMLPDSHTQDRSEILWCLLSRARGRANPRQQCLHLFTSFGAPLDRSLRRVFIDG